jgi:hypothetical protein
MDIREAMAGAVLQEIVQSPETFAQRWRQYSLYGRYYLAVEIARKLVDNPEWFSDLRGTASMFTGKRWRTSWSTRGELDSDWETSDYWMPIAKRVPEILEKLRTQHEHQKQADARP